MSVANGTRIGVYEIQAAIGAGGMGEVYRARDTRLQRDVALKMLPDAFASDQERLARFEREARTLASLNHPHIASVHGFEESGGLHALVMELVEGPTLAERIARARCRSTRRSRWRCRSPTPWKPRTNRESSTAISSPPTSRSVTTAP